MCVLKNMEDYAHIHNEGLIHRSNMYISMLYCVWDLTFSLGMVLDISAGLIMAGTPPRNDTAVFINLKLLFSFSSSSLNSTDGESGPSFTKK